MDALLYNQAHLTGQHSGATMRLRTIPILLILLLTISACNLERPAPASAPTAAPPITGTLATVTRIIDGDTIDVEIDGQVYRVRYIGMNTPERGEPCFEESTEANRRLVAGRQVRLERDVSETDRFDRLLRYVYVDEVFVNAMLVEQGWAEAVRYPPDVREFNRFVALEQQAALAGLGCHPTGIFDDGTYER
jgi:endonuclease YncB( thermonuclease family)